VLTGSALELGIVSAFQFLPVLLFSLVGGVVVDRVPKRSLIICTQTASLLLALVLGLLTWAHVVQLWHVYLLAFLLGMNTCFENPARQSFVLEMVGPTDLRNAVSLNSVLVNAARAVGPAIAGIIISTAGVGLCFLLNALSFVAVVLSLASLDTSRLQPAVPAARAKGQLREGLRYVWATPRLVIPLLMMAIVGCLAYEFSVSLPVLAKQTFGGQASTYGFMTAAMGVGAVIGGLYVAARGRTGTRALMNSAAVFTVVLTGAALAPTLWLELPALGLVGAASVGFLSKGNSTLQLVASPQMRGRVMALWTVAFLGSTPIGGPIVGWVSESLGGRAGLGLGALSCAAATLLGALSLRRLAARATASDGAASDPADQTVGEGTGLPVCVNEPEGTLSPDAVPR
jgi:MFS family permease